MVVSAPTNGAAITITNNNFSAGTGCVGVGIISLLAGTNVTVTIRYNTFEQSYNNNYSNILLMNSVGSKTIEYNVFLHTAQHVVSLQANGALTLKNNYAVGTGCCGNHGDWFIINIATAATLSIDEGFNTVAQDRALAGEGFGATALCYIADVSAITLTSGKCTNNTYISRIGDDGFGHVSAPIRVEQAGTWSPGPFDISNNYIDWTGSVFAILSTGSFPHTCVGNKDLTTGGGITGTFGNMVCN